MCLIQKLQQVSKKMKKSAENPVLTTNRTESDEIKHPFLFFVDYGRLQNAHAVFLKNLPVVYWGN